MKKQTKGFALIEVLVAIVILSFLVFAIHQITNNSFNASERILSEDKDLLQLQTALNRIQLDLSQLYSATYWDYLEDEKMRVARSANSTTDKFYTNNFRYRTFDQQPVPYFEQKEPHTIILFTNANRRKLQDIKQSYFAWIQYTLRNSELPKDATKEEIERRSKGPYELIRYYDANNPYASDHDWEKIKPQVLLRNVKSLKFTIWDREQKKFVENISELNDKSTLRAVKFQLVYIDQYGVETTITRVSRPLWPFYDTAILKQERVIATQPAAAAAPQGGPDEN